MLEHCKRLEEHVFINPETGLPYTDLKKGLASACENSGIKGLSWHCLRHTFGTRLSDAGANAFEIMELMGHSSIKTSERYVHPSTERKRAAVEQIMTLHRQTCPNPAPEEERRPLLVAVNS